MTENGEILPHSAQGPGTLLSGDVSTSPGAEENFFLEKLCISLHNFGDLYFISTVCLDTWA